MLKLTDKEKQALQLIIDNASDVDKSNGIITYFSTFRNNIDEKQIPGFRGICSSLKQKDIIDIVDGCYVSTTDIPTDENGKVKFEEEIIKEDANEKVANALSYLFHLYFNSFAKTLSSKYPELANQLLDIARKEEPMSKFMSTEVKENKELTEAPDDDGILSDDELDAEDEKERAEFEARLKARRDKVAQQRAERDAKAKRDAELKTQAEEKLKEIGNDWSFEHVFDTLVPDSGKCDTLAGEILRAVNKIEYRWFNDGDRFNEDYGIETCGQPAYFLAQIEVDDGEPFWDLILDVDKNGDDSEYEKMIENLKSKAIELLKAHNELLATETNDMYDVKERDVERFLDEYDLVPKYDYDAEIPPELQAHLDKGNIDERDLIWEVQSWIENMSNSTDDVRVDWGNVYIYDLSKADYDELEGNLYRWLEQYAEDLTEEYGDPEEEEEDWATDIANELGQDVDMVQNVLDTHKFDSYDDALDYVKDLIEEESEEEEETEK